MVGGPEFDSHHATLEYLASLGLPVNPEARVCGDLDEVRRLEQKAKAVVKRIARWRPVEEKAELEALLRLAALDKIPITPRGLGTGTGFAALLQAVRNPPELGQRSPWPPSPRQNRFALEGSGC